MWYDSHGVYGMHIMGVVPKMDGIHIICTEVLVAINCPDQALKVKV